MQGEFDGSGINMLELMPQRYPFLMIDTVLELSRERVCTGKKVTEGDALTVSASYMMENMAQSASVLFGYRSQAACRQTELAGVEEADVPCLPAPGDVVMTEVTVELAVGNLAKVRCESHIKPPHGSSVSADRSESANDRKATAVFILFMA